MIKYKIIKFNFSNQKLNPNLSYNKLTKERCKKNTYLIGKPTKLTHKNNLIFPPHKRFNKKFVLK